MPRAIDLTGQQFGNLTALQRAGKRGGAWLWDCQCQCGRPARVSTADLRRGNTRSCGCQSPYLRAVR